MVFISDYAMAKPEPVLRGFAFTVKDGIRGFPCENTF